METVPRAGNDPATHGFSVRSAECQEAAPFWRLIDRSAGPGACWPWTGSRNRCGYGKTSGGRLAHRVAYERSGRTIPPGLLLRHSCHNPPCCNPDHLSPGTPADNAADMVAAGRQTLGERNPIAKLTEADVVAMRTRRAAGSRVTDLAADYDVSDSLVSQICTGRLWRHLRGPLTPSRLTARHLPAPEVA